MNTTEAISKSENRRVKMTKKLLKNALLEMLETESIYKIKVRELCDNADVNRSTFYKYYESPMQLLNSIMDDIIKNLDEKIIRIQDNDYNPMREILIYAKDNIKVLTLLLKNDSDYSFKKRLLSLDSINNQFEKNYANIPENTRRYIKAANLAAGVEVLELWLNGGCVESIDEIVGTWLLSQGVSPITSLA